MSKKLRVEHTFPVRTDSERGSETAAERWVHRFYDRGIFDRNDINAFIASATGPAAHIWDVNATDSERALRSDGMARRVAFARRVLALLPAPEPLHGDVVMGLSLLVSHYLPGATLTGQIDGTVEVKFIDGNRATFTVKRLMFELAEVAEDL